MVHQLPAVSGSNLCGSMDCGAPAAKADLEKAFLPEKEERGLGRKGGRKNRRQAGVEKLKQKKKEGLNEDICLIKIYPDCLQRLLANERECLL